MAGRDPQTLLRMASTSAEENPVDNTHVLSRESRSAPAPRAMGLQQIRQLGASRMTTEERAAEIKLFKDLRDEANEMTKNQQHELKALEEHVMQLRNKACNSENVNNGTEMFFDQYRRRLIQETKEEIYLCQEKIKTAQELLDQWRNTYKRDLDSTEQSLGNEMNIEKGQME